MSKIKIKVKQSGFKSEDYLKKISTIFNENTFIKIAEESLNDFIEASPNMSIASGWSYKIENKYNKINLIFENSFFENGENIAIIIDIGHATSSGKWISGKNYLKEPIRKTYARINKLLKEAQ